MFSRRSNSAYRTGEDSLRAPPGNLQNIGETWNVQEILSIPVPFSRPGAGLDARNCSFPVPPTVTTIERFRYKHLYRIF